MNIVFVGTPVFAEQHLAAVITSKHKVVGIVTRPDRPAGRGRALKPSPVKKLSLQHGIQMRQPASLQGDETAEWLRQLKPDVIIVVAYGLIIPRAILDIPFMGCLNVHASLLPRWRGAAPIQRAIQHGDGSTGVSIMQMDSGLDTGAILLQETQPITQNSTAKSLAGELTGLGIKALLTVLDDLPAYQKGAEIQDDQNATYAPKITKPEAALPWARSAGELVRLIHAFNPAPVCFSYLGCKRIRIWEASEKRIQPQTQAPGTILELTSEGILVACGKHAISLLVVQLPGGKPRRASELYQQQSIPVKPGARFRHAHSQ